MDRLTGHGRLVCEEHGTVYLSCRCIHGADHVYTTPCRGYPTCKGALKPPVEEELVHAVCCDPYGEHDHPLPQACYIDPEGLGWCVNCAMVGPTKWGLALHPLTWK